jgi:hypothetical protein
MRFRISRTPLARCAWIEMSNFAVQSSVGDIDVQIPDYIFVQNPVEETHIA